MRQLILVAHNLRSTHNVGSLLRTAEGLGVSEVWLTGYTPYPAGGSDDDRLPHLARKVDAQIAKTALGAEKQIKWHRTADIARLVQELRQQGVTVIGLEQTPKSLPLPEFQPPDKLALIVGREVEGLEPEVLQVCDQTVEIPMFGKKESFNVVQAAAMALYYCRFML
ncbi:MAG TPA: TrmH family RNA methyltransferase [Candidatus Saccharimonadales bacterium]|nr:TrmH family RNA methyltransferase [Candidatus Saccharimonadales bacterium]